MAEGPYLMGIDFGTGGARVGIFDPEGTPLVFTEREFRLDHPRPGMGRAGPGRVVVFARGSGKGRDGREPRTRRRDRGHLGGRHE